MVEWTKRTGRTVRALALAAGLAAIGPAAVAAGPDAAEMIEEAASQAIEALAERKAELEANPVLVYDFVQEYLLPYFDFEYASRLVLGRNWRTATDGERERFQEAFQRTLIRSYGAAMLKYSDQTFRYLPYREEPGSQRTTVRTEIDVGDSQPVPVDYVLHRVDDDWRIFDVIIDGISVVVNYRGTFGSEIRRLGGLTPLIEKMEERNRSNVLDPAPGELPDADGN